MKHIRYQILSLSSLVCLALSICTSYAQNSVGIGTASPNPKSVVDLQSNSQGFLMPRLSTTQRIGINPQAGDGGLLVYDNTLHKFVYWNAGANAWQTLGGAGSGVWQSGSGAPDNSTGQEGDFYLNVLTKELFRKNNAGIYSSLFILGGDQFWQSADPSEIHTFRNVGIGINNPTRALDVKGYIASFQLSGGGNRLLFADNDGTILPLSTAANAGFLRNNGAGILSWEPLNIAYTAGLGIQVDAINLIIRNTGDINASDDITIGSPASGDLSGTYPNPAIKANAVTSAKLDDGAVTNAKLANNSVTAAKIASGLPNTQLVTDGSGTVAWVGSSVTPLAAGEIAVGAGGGVNNNVVPYQDVTLALDGKTTVVKLQGNAVNALYPSANQVLTWDGTKWTPLDIPPTSLPNIAGGSILVGDGSNVNVVNMSRDVSLASDGKATVQGLRGTSIDPSVASLATLDNGKVLTWNSTSGQWEAKSLTAALPTAATTNQVLQWNGAAWVAATSPTQTLADKHIWVGSGVSAPVARKMQDLSLNNSNEVVVSGLQNNPVDNTILTTTDAEKVLTWSGSRWIAKASAATNSWTENASEVTLTNTAKNVGIGVANPTAKLQVAGQVSASEVVAPLITAGNFLSLGSYASSTASAGTFRWNGLNYIGRNATQDLNFLATPTFGSVGQVLTSTGTSAQWQTPVGSGSNIWSETASEVKLVTGAKKVGIGVSLPSPLVHQLEVDGITRTSGLYANYMRLFGPAPSSPSIPGVISYNSTSNRFIGWESASERTFITVPGSASPTDGQVPTFDGVTSNVVWRIPTGSNLPAGTVNKQTPIWNMALNAWLPRDNLDADLNSSNQIINTGLRGKPLDTALETLAIADVNKVLTWNGAKWIAQTSTAVSSIALESQNYTSPQTRYYSVDPVEFVAIDDDYHVDYVNATGNEAIPVDGSEYFLAAALHLPHGALVSRVEFRYIDDDNNDNMDFSFVRNDDAAVTSVVSSSSSSSKSASYRTMALAASETIDNEKYSYKIIARTKSNKKHRLTRAKITYTVTKPD